MPEAIATLESMTGCALEILRKLKASDLVQSKTLELIELADKRGVLASCSSIGGAAGIVYIAGILTRNPTTLADVAEAAGISPSTTGKYKSILAKQMRAILKFMPKE